MANLADADVVWHTVQRGETLWGIAERYYGAGEEFERIIDANVGRPMPGNRTFTPAGMIYPGAVLEVPLPSSAIEEHNGQRFYVVEPGDTLRGIAARLLGDPERYEDVFALNVGVAQLGEQGAVLTDPDLIWPGLRLQLGSAEANSPEPSAAQSDEGASATATPPPAPAPAVAPDQQERTTVEKPAQVEHRVADVEPDVPLAPAPATLTAPTQVAEPTEDHRTEPWHPLSPEQAALAAAGAAVAALGAGTLVVRRRRSSPIPSGPESDIRIEDGFAQVDPVEDLARRLARTSDPAAAIASLLGQAYVAIFDEQLGVE